MVFVGVRSVGRMRVPQRREAALQTSESRPGEPRLEVSDRLWVALRFGGFS